MYRVVNVIFYILGPVAWNDASDKGTWTATVSSYFNNDATKYAASKLIDRQYFPKTSDTNALIFWQVENTAQKGTDWVQIDFGQQRGIYRVIILGR